MTEVTTRAGRLRGMLVETQAGRARAFLGIPYATAPRFGAPAPAPRWPGTRDATAFGPAAPQPRDSTMGALVPGGYRGPVDEHACLTVNVWTPTRASDGPRPVLVWFPGGAFTVGAASQPVYDGARLCAEQDVVVVSANYRLGALGFLDARPLGGTANCGLRDAIAALEWVRDHVDAFGGDPARITAFGESAGGGIVLHACASPAARGLLRGAIVQSGATFGTLDEAGAAAVLDALLAELGTDPAAADPATASVAALLDAQSAAAGALLGTVGMMPFHPMVDGDVLPAPPLDALLAGAAAGVPLLVGTTTDEMRLFLDLTGPPPERERLVKRVARYLRVDAARAGDVVASYERLLAPAEADELWAALFSDAEMQRPADAMRAAHAPHGPTYAYLFGWPAATGALGACHGIDLPFTFGNFVDGWAELTGAATAEDAPRAEALSRRMRDAWAAFARDGSPGWDQVPTTMLLARECSVVDDPLRARLASLPG